MNLPMFLQIRSSRGAAPIDELAGCSGQLRTGRKQATSTCSWFPHGSVPQQRQLVHPVEHDWSAPCITWGLYHTRQDSPVRACDPQRARCEALRRDARAGPHRPVAPATSTRVTAACGVSNSSLPAPRPRNSASSSARLLPIGPLSLVNCCHTSSKICLRAARARRVTSPARLQRSSRSRQQGRCAARLRACAASLGAKCPGATWHDAARRAHTHSDTPLRSRAPVSCCSARQGANAQVEACRSHVCRRPVLQRIASLIGQAMPCARLDLRPITTGLKVSMVNPSSLSPSTSGLAPLLRRPPRLRRPCALRQARRRPCCCLVHTIHTGLHYEFLFAVGRPGEVAAAMHGRVFGDAACSSSVHLLWYTRR
jgi:hypothetical protein